MIEIVIHEDLEKNKRDLKRAIYDLWQKLQGLSKQELTEIQFITLNEKGEIQEIR